VRELLDFFNDQVEEARAKNLDGANQPDFLLKIASGRFIEVFKLLNQRSQYIRKKCPG